VAAPDSFTRRLDARVAEALDKRLVSRVGSGRSTWLAKVVAAILVTPVHLVSIGLAAGGIALLLLGAGWWQWLMAAFLLAVAWTTKPALSGRAAPGTVLVAPTQAPALTALVGEVSTLLGTPAPQEIRLCADLNAFVAPRRLRGRQLVLGAPLWTALGPQERMALLGHELGHLAHGDLLNLRYVGSAYRTLHRWEGLLDPTRSEVFAHSTPILARVLMVPPRLLVVGYGRLLDAVNSAASRRQELYADLASVVVAGTEGTVGCLEVTLMGEAVDVVANRAAVDPTRPDLGEAIATRMAGYDAEQRANARRRGESDRRSIDASHPPTVERLRLVESVEPSAAGIVLDLDRSRLIDKELAPYLQRKFKQMGERYRYVR